MNTLQLEGKLSRRRSLRLPHYDYASPGAYFVTICTRHRSCLFGQVRDGTMHPNRFGRAVDACWRGLPDHYPHLALDAFVVMPNHIHGIFVLKPSDNRSSHLMTNGHSVNQNVKRHALFEVVRAFKTFSARYVNDIRNAPGQPLWQRGYYEHVIRDDLSLTDIREYITGNPARWAFDRENPANRSLDAVIGAGFKPAPTEPGGTFR